VQYVLLVDIKERGLLRAGQDRDEVGLPTHLLPTLTLQT